MTEIYINSEEQFQEVLKAHPNIAESVIISHKDISFYLLEGWFKKYYPNVVLREATLGTSIYTKYGYRTCIVTYP